MLDAREDLDLAAEAHRGVVILGRRMQHLQRALGLGLHVPHAIDRAHAAAAEGREDLVAAGKDFARAEGVAASAAAWRRRLIVRKRARTLERNGARRGLGTADAATAALFDELEATLQTCHG